MHQRLDFMGALVSFVTAKSHGARNVQLKNFLPDWDRTPKVQDPEELRMVMEGLISQPSPPSSST